jgi:hypothetical protein
MHYHSNAKTNIFQRQMIKEKRSIPNRIMVKTIKREHYKDYSLSEYLLRNSRLQEISGLPQLSEKTESIAKLDSLR